MPAIGRGHDVVMFHTLKHFLCLRHRIKPWIRLFALDNLSIAQNHQFNSSGTDVNTGKIAFYISPYFINSTKASTLVLSWPTSSWL